MTPNPPVACQTRTGFVILHKCNQPADAQCGMCGKYICRKHTHIHAGAPVCETCLEKAAPEEYKKVAHAREHSRHYYGYHPYYYPHYSNTEHDLFSRSDISDSHETGEGS